MVVFFGALDAVSACYLANPQGKLASYSTEKRGWGRGTVSGIPSCIWDSLLMVGFRLVIDMLVVRGHWMIRGERLADGLIHVEPNDSFARMTFRIEGIETF